MRAPSLLFLSLGAFIACGTVSMAADSPTITYPATRQDDHIDDYHGVKVADPYRWLEDDHAPETEAWVAAENKVTNAFLETIPERAPIKERITKLWNYERFGAPFQEGGRYFYMHNSGLQNQRVLYWMPSLDGEARVLLDPNTLSKDGTVALNGYSVSDDGKLLAYGLSKAGSDWEQWHVMEVDTRAQRDDLLEWVKFSGASWAKDGSGFYYSRYDAPKEGEEKRGVNEFQKLYFHKLGTKQSEDALVYERKDHADWGFEAGVTDDGRYLIIHVSKGTDTMNRVFYKDLTAQNSKVTELIPDFDASYEFIDNEGSTFYIKTDMGAPRGRIVAINLEHPNRPNWREVLPESADPLKAVSVVHGDFVCAYLKDAHSEVKIYHWSLEEASQPGKGATRAKLVKELPLPGFGSANGFGGKRKDDETFYVFTSYTVPGIIYRYDFTTGQSTVFREPKVDFKPADFETKQVFVRSKDGTMIPMFITAKKGIVLDGTNPTLLYGYGGFNISITPSFHVPDLVWMEMGGVYAVANIRGGGEYGEEWHQAGIKLKKQNVFDDFIAASEWLIRNGYTSRKKLAIQGGSNGGLLVGACMTQRPDLYGAALPAVGVMDMLRFDKFTIGWAWKSDYGSSEDPEQFKALLAYSPLQNLKPGVRYPATLVLTGDHDDRVVPAHSFKFAARLQACQAADGPPVLIRIETQAGHGGGKPMSKVIEENADQLGFLVRELGMKPVAY